jgi:hypothetical protein
MELIEKYVYAVTKDLPTDQRDDVAKELKASIEDMVADQGRDVEEVLKELGDPAILAYKYNHKKRYLIGPRWYNAYISLLIKLLKIVPPIIVILAVFAKIIEDRANISGAIVNGIGAGIAVAIQTTFWVTLIFVLMERSGVKPQEMMEKWSLNKLPELPKKRQVSYSDSISSFVMIIIGSLFLLYIIVSPGVFLSSYYQGAVINRDISILWLIVFLVIQLLELIQKGFLIKIGNWILPLVISNILIKLVSIGFFVALFTTQTVINPELVDAINNYANVENFRHWASLSIDITFAMIIIVALWETFESIRLHLKLRK